MILDKAGALTILFANPKYDISDEVLDNLGAASSGRKGRLSAGQKGLEPGAGSNPGTSKGTQQGDTKGNTNQPPSSVPNREKK
jgi:hypothetical protein